MFNLKVASLNFRYLEDRPAVALHEGCRLHAEPGHLAIGTVALGVRRQADLGALVVVRREPKPLRSLNRNIVILLKSLAPYFPHQIIAQDAVKRRILTLV